MSCLDRGPVGILCWPFAEPVVRGSPDPAPIIIVRRKPDLRGAYHLVVQPVNLKDLIIAALHWRHCPLTTSSSSTRLPNVTARGAGGKKNAADELQHALKSYWGFDDYLPLQREAMQCVMDDRDSLVVMPTGGRESLCSHGAAFGLHRTR